ncbi:MAG: LON peptidase substrate-binding domain-containing protein, partial [Bacteroidia bacterium]|nr:LON peptidase substrate-binding domain-containing protein [Bacteroidia bacterium]
MRGFLPLDLTEATEGDEFIPLMTNEDEESLSAKKIPDALPILPLRNTVLFPGVVIPITVGRDKSIRLIRDANKGDKLIGVVAQKDISIEDPALGDLNNVGTVAQMLKMLRMPDGNTTVIIQGKRRFAIKEVVQTTPYFKCTVKPFEETRPDKNDKEFSALISALKDLALQIIQQSPNIPSEAAFAIRSIE